MPNRKFIQKLGFRPKENESDIFYKKYPFFGDYIIEADFQKNKFNFGSKIKSDSGTTQNFSQEENWIVLECVNRLLEKGYKPEDITLEKIYPTGHGTSGRLDILVKKDTKAYLMIECKTWGNEYQKALKKMQKDGGQLFTYFQQDRDTQYLMLYASEFNKGEINFESEIVKIEEHYREAGNVKDLYDRWNKLSKSNGIFDEWVNAYEFQNKALTVNSLKDIKQEDSQKVFNRFLEILRKHVVSDKPNAFNKIFNLFLCKIRDEFDDNDNDRELKFQWKSNDTQEIFQSRLNRLYREGMKIFLGKEIVDFDEEDLKNNFPEIANNEKQKKHFMEIINEIRLKKSNEFAIKEVHDQKSFEENGVVLKELVELIQEYKIRYDRRHPYLSDFFELLLTTGLKQESGQFFTPVPVARYILKSLPIKEKIQEKINNGDSNDLLPMAIDYASGSGHFLHEIMHEIQTIIDTKDFKNKNSEITNEIDGWRIGKFRWAKNYIYGIEKDYRLAKVAKVGCYLHGDGLAQVIHGDGLDNFYDSKDYVNILKKQDNKQGQNNPSFDFIISNPPYSVSSFKGNMKNAFNAFGEGKHSFELYDSLTDQSSEIECLFIERTKQLLKDDGLAGIILPSSILSNTGIYTKTREILFKYFEIIGITELGSGTFMATGTNTVILFLRRRNNYEWQNIQSSIEKFFQNYSDITVNGVEHIFTKYVEFVWEGITFEDYLSLCKNTINKNIENHEIYKEYEKKLKTKDRDDLQKKIIEKEQEKLLYFILAYAQKVILTKSGQKKEEKKFLGYEFSNRRGYEGIHPIQRGKSIDECTKMYDSENQDDEAKANSYVYKAFLGKKNQKIHRSLEKNIFEISLIDLMTFNRVDFEKTILLAFKKKIKIEDSWNTKNVILLNEVANIQKGTTITQERVVEGNIPVVAGGQTPAYFHNKANRNGNIITVSASGAYAGFVNYFSDPIFASDCNTVQTKDESIISTKLIFEFLKSIQEEIYSLQRGQAQPHVYGKDLENIKIPLLSKDIQEKIVYEIGNLEKKEKTLKEKIKELKEDIFSLLGAYDKGYVYDICSISDKKENPLDYAEKEYMYVGLEHIESNTGRILVAKKEYGKNILSTKNVFEKGNILYGKLRPYLNKVAMPSFNGVCSTDILVLKTDVPLILKYALLSNDFVKQTADSMKGVHLPRIGVKDFLNQKISFPPLPTQQKIVMEIEKIEKQIKKINQELQEIEKQKIEVLKKYL